MGRLWEIPKPMSSVYQRQLKLKLEVSPVVLKLALVQPILFQEKLPLNLRTQLHLLAPSVALPHQLVKEPTDGNGPQDPLPVMENTLPC